MKGGVPNETMAVLKPLFDRSKLGMTGQNLADAAMIHLWKGLYYNDKKMVLDVVSSFLSFVFAAFFAPGKWISPVSGQ